MHGVIVSELIRRLEQLLRYGTIDALDLGAARCRVRSGELLSNWIPWLAQRNSPTKAVLA
jgi:phage baseplate assembly protein gpV